MWQQMSTWSAAAHVSRASTLQSPKASPPGLLHTLMVFHSWSRASPSFDREETQAREGQEMMDVLLGTSSILFLHLWICELWEGPSPCCGMTKHPCRTSCQGPITEAGTSPARPLAQVRQHGRKSHISLCPSPDLSSFVSWGEAGASQLTIMCFNRMRSWSLSNR